MAEEGGKGTHKEQTFWWRGRDGWSLLLLFVHVLIKPANYTETVEKIACQYTKKFKL
jgi:hypothetical protein